MRLLLSIFFVLMFGSFYGQLTESELNYIDSIQNSITEDTPDTVSLSLYNQISDITNRYAPKRCIEVSSIIDSICELRLQGELDKEQSNYYSFRQAKALLDIGRSYQYHFQNNYDIAIASYEKAKEIAIRYNHPQLKTACVGNLGQIYQTKGDYKKALSYMNVTLSDAIESGNRKYEATAISYIGIILENQGNYPLALKKHYKSLAIYQELNDSLGISIQLTNIGSLFNRQNEHKKAIELLEQAAAIDLRANDIHGYASTLINIGSSYQDQENHDKALEIYEEALEIATDLEVTSMLATLHHNIGSVLIDKENYEAALPKFQLAFTMREELEDLKGMSSSLNGLATVHLKLGQVNLALQEAQQGYKYASEIGHAIRSRECSRTLYEVYSELGNTGQALKHFEIYIELKDSLENDENTKSVIRQQFTFDAQQIHLTDSIQSAARENLTLAKLQASDAENEKKSQQIWYLAGILLLFLALVIFVFNRFKVAKKQKNIIQEQKTQVDHAFDQLGEKNKEILDSITYAKRIQSAILPTDKNIADVLNDAFVLYLPKDIVAGDFYWLEQTKESTLFAAADCTGHGVPGALVSVVCNNALNRSVREFKLRDPGKILDKTREIVIEEFLDQNASINKEVTGESIKDGMDIAICSLNGLKLKYAGAHNPLWIYREGELIEIKADKQPIGQFEHAATFKTHEVELQKGDTIYLFSDGFADQFGGEKGKKMKSSNFKRLLGSIQDQSIKDQKIHLEKSFREWMGSFEQLDDVCVIGVRI